MAQKKAHEVEAWLRRRDPRFAVVLLYGPDRGLVSERARALVEASGVPIDDPFSVTRLDAAELEQQPGRLIDEARTVPMFAEHRLIWVRNAGVQKALAEEAKALASDPPEDALVLIEAGDLKKGAALRLAVESADRAMALPCYPDEARGLDALIDQEMQKAGLSIAPEARHALRASLGGDRLASRGELEKLALYAAGAGTVSLTDVMASVGDAAALSMDDIVDAAFTGDLQRFDSAFARLSAAGSQATQLLTAALRQAQSLHLLRVRMEAGSLSAAAAVAAARPPIFFGRRKTVEDALRRWPAGALQRAAARLHAALLQTRRRPELAAAATRHALIAIGAEAARR